MIMSLKDKVLYFVLNPIHELVWGSVNYSLCIKSSLSVGHTIDFSIVNAKLKEYEFGK